MAAKLTRKLNGARERRERWRFDIRLTQCDGLGELDKTDLGSGRCACSWHATPRWALLACTMRSSIGVVIRPTVGLPRLLRTFNSATRHKVAVSPCAAVAGGRASWAADAVLSLVCTLKPHEGGAPCSHVIY